MIILHLLRGDDWDALSTETVYRPPSLDAEGFVHCTDDVSTLLSVANRFYREIDGEMVMVELNIAKLAAPVLWEAPAHPDGSPATDGEPRFPHVYGPIPLDAVAGISKFVRSDDGSYLGLVGGR